MNCGMSKSFENPEFREQHSVHGPALLTLLLAFACVYIIWGSTYLAIRVAVQTLPPLIMAGVRFLVAGAVMYTWLRYRGVPHPTRVHWRSALIIGGLMLFGGNGAVVLAETMIHSNIAALLVATVPLWMVFLNAIRPGGRWPNVADCIGLLAGFAGVYVLLDPSNVPAEATIHPVGAALVLIASLLWAIGSLYSRHAPLPQSRSLATAIQMLAGGALLVVAGVARGEWATMDPQTFSVASLLALAYLTVFGSIIAFTAYMWLLHVTTPARVGTYAYVNPVVAVVLGWSILSEPVPPATIAAMTLIVIAVALITTYGRRERRIVQPKSPKIPVESLPCAAATRE